MEVKNCTECANYKTCKNTYYGWLGCNPKPKQEEKTNEDIHFTAHDRQK